MEAGVDSYAVWIQKNLDEDSKVGIDPLNIMASKFIADSAVFSSKKIAYKEID